MNYPLISEYIEAIESAEDNFATLTNLRSVLDEYEHPVMTSGNFAVVFKMRDEMSGKFYAVKCFLKDQSNRAENYRMIAEELEYVSSNFLTKFQYLDNELFVDSANADGDEFPVLLMDWVEGVSLDLYIRQHIEDSYQLHMLAYQFSRLAMWLMPQPFAHGDLKPDNIMVREDGTLVLIDYDGMFVPAMKGQKAREMGSTDFRHPARTINTFNEHIDDFSLVSIQFSLRAIAEEPSLLEKYGAADRLLFSENDYRDIHSCQLLRDIFPSECAEVNTLVGLFIIALTQSDLSNVFFRLLSLNRPKEPEIEIVSTEVTEEDMKDAWTDEFGVKYSKDGKRLLKYTIFSKLTQYSIRNGTSCICDRAFGFTNASSLRSITIPKSVISIGKNPFGWCHAKIINLSKCFTLFEGNLYTSDMKKLISYLSEENVFFIPRTVTYIGDSAFWGCSSLKSITIPDSVTSIGAYSFYMCNSLQFVTISDFVTSIGDSAFACCSSLKSITIPNSVTSIGKSAFRGCSSLKSLTIPDTVASIDESTFEDCKSLQSISVPDSVTSICDNAFKNCESLKSFSIPRSVISIGKNPFVRCHANVINYSKHFTVYEGNLYTSDRKKLISHLTLESHFAIPDTVQIIGPSALQWCQFLQSVTIPNSVTSIEDEAFSDCESLQFVTIPNSVISIGDSAFMNCSSLYPVTIPKTVIHIGKWIFDIIPF